MKIAAGFAAALLMAFTTASAQTGVTGTWRVDGEGPSLPWTVVLRADGVRVTGVVSQCANNRAEIFDGKVDGNSIEFKCRNAGGTRTVSFNGTLNRDEIAFTWQVQIQDGGLRVSPANRMFGPLAPATFIASRVPDGALADTVTQVKGVELAASANLVAKDTKVEGLLFLPQNVRRVRAVIVVIGWGRGFDFYSDPESRRLAQETECGLLLARMTSIPNSRAHTLALNAAGGGAEGLGRILHQLATDSGHQELANAPLLFWGHSGGAQFGPTYGALHPDRTIAFVGYQGMAVREADVTNLSRIPALFFGDVSTLRLFVLGDVGAGGTAEPSSWKAGRTVGAPWTFAVEPNAKHGDMEYLKKAHALTSPWIAAVLRQRLPQDGRKLTGVPDEPAWLANNRTGEVAPSRTFTGSKLDASWLPDEPSALGWTAVTGGIK